MCCSMPTSIFASLTAMKSESDAITAVDADTADSVVMPCEACETDRQPAMSPEPDLIFNNEILCQEHGG